jgi:iron complex outermembrane receptor protein
LDVNTVRFVYASDFGSDVQESPVDPLRFDPGLFLDTQGIAPRYRTRTIAQPLTLGEAGSERATPS